MTRKDLKGVKSALALFHLLGLTDEQISLLPQVLANWPTVVKNMNAMAADLATVKAEISRGPQSGDAPHLDTEENIRRSVGFGSHVELVSFDEGGGK